MTKPTSLSAVIHAQLGDKPRTAKEIAAAVGCNIKTVIGTLNNAVAHNKATRNTVGWMVYQAPSTSLIELQTIFNQIIRNRSQPCAA